MASSENQNGVSEVRPQWMITEDYIDALKGAHTSRRENCRDRDTKSDFFDALKDLLYLRDNLHGAMQELTQPSTSDWTTTVRDLLYSADVGADRLHEFISRNLRGEPLRQAPTNESAAIAQRVFEVPELMEMTLLHLKPYDVLAAARVNKAFATSVASSFNLQRKLCLQNDVESYWRTMFGDGSIRGIDCYIASYESPESVEHNEVEIFVRLSNLLRTRSETGHGFACLPPQCRKMLICQPPIKEMWVGPNCCSVLHRRRYQPSLSPDLPALHVIRSSTGLTIGDLLQFADELAEAHKHCPYADEIDHDMKTGEVHTGISFEGKMVLRPSDPAIQSWDDDDTRRSPLVDRRRLPPVDTLSLSLDDYEDEFFGREHKPTEMQKYIDAKRHALANGDPIPTFENWKATETDARVASESDGATRNDEAEEQGNYEGDGHASVVDGDDEYLHPET